MPIKIYMGPTGCGKTYQAFNRLGKKSAIYGGPCRQLIYETAQKYGNIKSQIKTSDIKIGNNSAKLSFCTYECITRKNIRQTDVLIIDEAHFMSDKERGPHIRDLIYFANKIGKEVVLLSATLKTIPKGAKIINLPPRGKNFIKKEISLSDAIERAKKGVPTLYFHKFKKDCGKVGEMLGIKHAIITSSTPVADRVRLVKLFQEGKITLLEATNAMAQGVNVPCENLINEYNRYDDSAVVIQKLGRLGRTGVTPEDSELTYCIGYDQDEIEDFKEEFTSFESKELKASKKTSQDFDLSNPSTKKEKNNLEKAIKKSWLHK